MLQRLFSRSLRGRLRLVFSVSCCKARGKHAKGRGGLPSFSSLVRARVLEISPFALKNRRLLRKLILLVWTGKFRDVSQKFKMSEYIWSLGAATQRWKKRCSSVYVQNPSCNVTCPCRRVAASSVCRHSIFSALSRATLQRWTHMMQLCCTGCCRKCCSLCLGFYPICIYRTYFNDKEKSPTNKSLTKEMN